MIWHKPLPGRVARWVGGGPQTPVFTSVPSYFDETLKRWVSTVRLEKIA